MGWSYPEVSKEDLMKLIKNFIDMLILASGYQSTGRLAHWDAHNIKKCFGWALFLENVSKGLTSSGDYQDSVKKLDAALHELTLNPHFPQGLAHLSCITFVRARDLLLEHLIQTLPLRETHLKATISASVEMDFSKIKRINNDCIDVYLEKLMRITSNDLNLSESRNFTVENISSPDAVPSGKLENWVDGDFSVLAIQQLGKRQLAVSCSSAVETGLENLWKTIEQRMNYEPGITSNTEPRKHLASIIAEDLTVEPIVWGRWRSRSLSYMFDSRTIRMLSGASLICSAPEGQWAQVFKGLNISAGTDDLCETIELLLLGCIADRWSALVEHLMLVSYESLTVSTLFYEVFDLPQGKNFDLIQKEGVMNLKKKSVVDYLEMLLSRQLNQLWELSPVLAAAAIPSWSQLFRSYLHELEGQVRGNSSATRRCSCIADAEEHRECEVAERIWCLYIFHILKSHSAVGATTVT